MWIYYSGLLTATVAFEQASADNDADMQDGRSGPAILSTVEPLQQVNVRWSLSWASESDLGDLKLGQLSVLDKLVWVLVDPSSVLIQTCGSLQDHNIMSQS